MDRGKAPFGEQHRDSGSGCSSSEQPCSPLLSSADNAQAMADDRRLYTLLREELTLAGCFRVSPLHTGLSMTAVMGLAGAAYAGLLAGPHWPMRLILCALYAFASVQAGFIGHEIGHLGIARRPFRSAVLGSLFMSVLGGVAFTYFGERHRKHHRHTNVFALDPDVRCAGSSVCPQSVHAKGASGMWITANQEWLMLPWIFLLAFGLKLEGCIYCLRRGRWADREKAALILHAAILIGAPALLLGVWPALLNYTILTACAGPYLAAVFYPNHIGVEGLGGEASEPFLRRQLVTTRNIAGGRLLNVLCGGLNHHIEHHLFPAISSRCLTRAAAITRLFCRRHDLPYREQSWRQGAGEVLAQIQRMSRLARELRRNVAAPALQDQV